MINSMDDNKTNQEENQPTPLYETVTNDQPDQTMQGQQDPQMMPEPMQPEEIPSDVSNPQEAFVGQAPEMPPPDEPPPIYDEQGSKMKYLFIGGGALFFILIFILFFSILLGGKKGNKQVNLTYW